jgi:signal transduction histidine kinase
MAGVAVDERVQGGRPVTPEFLTALSGGVVNLRYVSPDGATLTGGPTVTASDREFSAGSGLPHGGELTVVRPADDISRRVSDALLPLVLLAVGLLLAAALAGWLLARALSRPFQELAVAARALARGRTGTTVPHYGPPEAEAIGEALREGLTRLERLREREEQFAISASHELRSPITAMRLRVESLGLHPGLPEDARHEVGELQRGLDRLSAAVLEVLTAAREERSTPVVDAGHLLTETVEAVPTGRARQRVELLVGAAPVLVGVPADAFTDVVAALLGDCLTAGQGTVRLQLTEHVSHVEVVVSDDGERRQAPDLLHPQTAPPQLVEAVTRAESFGSRLMVADAPTQRYRLLVPRSGS